MSDKVYRGTPKTQTSMCLNCRNALTARGLNREEVVYCRATGNQALRVTFPVVECSSFDDKAQPALYQMENIAWIVKSRNRGPVGFVGDGKTEVVVEPPSQDYPRPAVQPGNGLAD